MEQISQWVLLVGAIFIAIKESRNAFSVTKSVWNWSKRNLWMPEVYRKLKHLCEQDEEHEQRIKAMEENRDGS